MGNSEKIVSIRRTQVNSTVNWRSNLNLLSALLGSIACETLGIEPHELTRARFTELRNKFYIVRHHDWMFCGFTGNSVPPKIRLDYENKVSEMVDSLDSRLILGKESLLEFMHVCSDNLDALCGGSGMVSQDFSKVDCPHCKAELLSKQLDTKIH